MRHAPPPARPETPFGFRFIAPLALGSTLNPINSTMIATALVPIATDYHASVAQAGWLIAGLYLASAVAQPTMGRLADLFGPRRVYLAALGLVALAGLIGRFAPSLGVLVAARVLLGIGTSGAYPSAMRIFRMQADRRGLEPPRLAMSFLSMAALSSAAVGPLIGGVLTGAFGWHSIFIVNVPLGLGAALLVLLWVPPDPPRTANLGRLVDEIDLVGVALFAAFLLGLMIFLMDLAHPSWPTLLAAAAFGAALVRCALRRRDPFIDVRMLARNAPLAITYLRAGAVASIVYGLLYGFAQWLESAAGFSSSRAGLMMLPLSVAGALSSLAGGSARGIRGPFLVSIGAALAGCVGLLLIGSSSPPWAIAAAVVLFGLPQGLFSTATQAAVYIQAPAAEIGAASGLQRTAQYLGAILATSALGLIYGARATDAGFHRLALVMGALGALLLAATLFDRTIPRGRV